MMLPAQVEPSERPSQHQPYLFPDGCQMGSTTKRGTVQRAGGEIPCGTCAEPKMRDVFPKKLPSGPLPVMECPPSLRSFLPEGILELLETLLIVSKVQKGIRRRGKLDPSCC